MLIKSWIYIYVHRQKNRSRVRLLQIGLPLQHTHLPELAIRGNLFSIAKASDIHHRTMIYICYTCTNSNPVWSRCFHFPEKKISQPVRTPPMQALFGELYIYIYSGDSAFRRWLISIPCSVIDASTRKPGQNIGNPYQMEDNDAAPSAPSQGGGASRRPLGFLLSSIR